MYLILDVSVVPGTSQSYVAPGTSLKLTSRADDVGDRLIIALADYPG